MTLICLRAITWSIQDLRAIKWSIQDLRAVTCLGGFNVHHSKSLLWWDKSRGTYTCVTCPVEYVWLSHPLSTRQIKDNSLEDAKTSEDDRLYSISLVSGRFCGKDMGVEYSRLFKYLGKNWGRMISGGSWVWLLCQENLLWPGVWIGGLTFTSYSLRLVNFCIYLIICILYFSI